MVTASMAAGVGGVGCENDRSDDCGQAEYTNSQIARGS
jgi:hypothetical protein